MPNTLRTSCAWAAGVVAFLSAGVTSADQRPLPFTFGYSTFAEGTRAVELAMDMVPLRVATDQNPPIGDRYQVHAGFGFAPTDHVELSGHLMLRQEIGGPATIDGLLERVKIRFDERDDLIPNIGVVAEVGELFDSILTAQRLVLEMPAGPVRLAANLGTEQLFYRGIKAAWIYVPTIGATVSPADHVSLGLEAWMRGYFAGSETDAARYGSATDENRRTHVYVGPALALAWTVFCWSVGAYVKADEPTRSVEVGDRFGRLWIRTVMTTSF
jgi:hypothetical protein